MYMYIFVKEDTRTSKIYPNFDELRASELMSLEGVILSGPNLEQGGAECSVVAYYTDFYKMVTKV